jgi:hypothetical protein
MKIPCYVDVHPHKWFGSDTSIEAIDLLMSRLKDVLLYTRAEYLEDLRQIQKFNSRLAPFYEYLVAECLIFTTFEPDHEYFVFSDSNSNSGALLCGWGSDAMRLKEYEYQSPKYPNSNEPTSLDDAIRFHNKHARDVTLIDPYFGTQLCKSSNPALALREFLSPEITEINIYTSIPKARGSEFSNWGEWLDPSGDIIYSLPDHQFGSLSNNQALFTRQFMWRLKRQLEKLSHMSTSKLIKVSLHSSANFPHDRHLASSFPSLDNSGRFIKKPTKDHFSLGNGLSTLGYMGRHDRASHVYHSDGIRMWTGFGTEVRENSLIGLFTKEKGEHVWTEAIA